jgi:hypothetical protein
LIPNDVTVAAPIVTASIKDVSVITAHVTHDALIISSSISGIISMDDNKCLVVISQERIELVGTTDGFSKKNIERRIDLSHKGESDVDIKPISNAGENSFNDLSSTFEDIVVMTCQESDQLKNDDIKSIPKLRTALF